MEIELVKFNKTSTNGLNKIGKLGIVITVEDKKLFNEYVKLVKKHFYTKVENRFTPSKNTTYYFYYIIENLNKILLSRFLLDTFLTALNNVKISYVCKIGDFKYDPIKLDTINEPWDNKIEIINNIINKFENPFSSGLILDIPTGSGKTVILSNITKHYVELGYRVHIVVTVLGLIEQTINEFVDKTYIRQLSGKKYSGVKKYDPDEDKSAYRVLISSIHSLVNLMKSRCIYDEFDDYYLTCIDEPQIITTKNRFGVLKMIQTKCMLGLSASADKSIFIKEYIGPIYKPPGFETVKLECEVVKLEYSGPDEFCQNIKRWFSELGEELNCAMQTNLLIETDPYRNQLIVNTGLTLLGEEHPCVLILSKNLAHIDALYDLLHNFDHISVSKWTGSRTQEQIDYAVNNANIILATYDSFGVGTNIPKITAIIYATSYKDQYKQIQFLGRAMRPHKNYNHIKRKIYDIVDVKVFLKSHFNDRQKIYKSKNLPIVVRKIKYSDMQ